MKNTTKYALAGAALIGLMTASPAMAGHDHGNNTDPMKPTHSQKHSCKAKHSCKGKAGCKAKAGCDAKSSCKGK